MRKITILAVIAVVFVALGTTAQITYPWTDNVVFELQQEPIDDDEVHITLTDLYFSLRDEEPCVIEPDWSVEVRGLMIELCYTLDKHQWNIDGYNLADILEDLANELEPLGE